jgi:hypothetical protein
MAKCDACGGHSDSHKMSQLLPKLQSPGIVDVCPACAKWATDRKWELIAQATEQLRLEIQDRASNPKPSWFARLRMRAYHLITS